MAIDREKPKHELVTDVTAERIARVYARAFMEVAAKSSSAAGRVDEVAAIVTDMLDQSKQLEEALRSALVSYEQKVKLLDRLLGKQVSVEVLNFLKVLAKHGRLELLRPIARILQKLHAERSGQREVELRVALDLDPAVRREIEEILRKTLRAEPVLTVRVDPSLIAGMIIRVGDRVYDGSISTQLERTRRQMIELAVEKIETEPDRFLQPA